MRLLRGCFRRFSTSAVERVLPAQNHSSGRSRLSAFSIVFRPRVSNARPESHLFSKLVLVDECSADSASESAGAHNEGAVVGRRHGRSRCRIEGRITSDNDYNRPPHALDLPRRTYGDTSRDQWPHPRTLLNLLVDAEGLATATWRSDRSRSIGPRYRSRYFF
jgi:hypothetical protein